EEHEQQHDTKDERDEEHHPDDVPVASFVAPERSHGASKRSVGVTERACTSNGVPLRMPGASPPASTTVRSSSRLTDTEMFPSPSELSSLSRSPCAPLVPA